jgi:phosphoesterase RecJ-like protein
MFADYNYVDPVAPACAQILIVVLGKLGIEINKDIGTCLLTGIITDTGGFKYEGVTTETFEFVAELIRKGVNVSEIYKRVMQVRTKANYLLCKKAIERMEFLEEGKIAFTYIMKADEEEANAEEGDHEGIVDIGRDVEGVEVSIFLREDEENVYKGSLRSNNYVNVSDICMIFGGGGHIRAAGCKINMPLEEAKNKMIKYVKEHI